jgi:hypothetical protein
MALSARFQARLLRRDTRLGTRFLALAASLPRRARP